MANSLKRTKLNLSRTQDDARPFERAALDAIWSHPEIGGFYPPSAKEAYRVESLVLQADGRPENENTASVLFELSNFDQRHIELAVRVSPTEWHYGGYIPVPTKDGADLGTLEAYAEEANENGFRLLSTAADDGRNNYAYELFSSRYQMLVFRSFTEIFSVRRPTAA